MKWLIFSFVFVCSLQFSLQRSTPQDDHYIAAVVEYEVSRDVEQNRLNYVRLIQEAAQQNADIVVFPELTLTNGTTSLPVPVNGLLREYPIPALYPDLYDELLVSMSEAARANQIYVLVNVRELMDCTTNDTQEYCPEEKEYVFNTNVILDRTGAVIDRYRKINLFGEYTHTPALRPDLGVFTTDFGVTFGHFICFDLMFQVPAVQVVQKLNITDVLFSTMWFSEMPYLTAVQIQEAYAYSLDVNFLGAGANNVGVGSAGSGIYSGRAGALISIMPGVPTTRLLVAKVPKVPGLVTEEYPGPIYDNPTEKDGLVLIRDPSLPSHVSQELVSGFQEFTLQDRDVSCKFTVRLNLSGTENAPKFRAVVQDGTTRYATNNIGVAACLIVACQNDSFQSCPYRYNNAEQNVYIEELQIEMRTYRHDYNRTIHCDNLVYFPVTLRNDKFPIALANVSYIDEQKNKGVCNKNKGNYNENEIKNSFFDIPKTGREKITFKINKPQTQVIAFGIWGRVYTRDVNHHKKPTEDDKDKFMTILDEIYSSNEVNNV